MKAVRAAKKAATLSDDKLEAVAGYDLTLDQLAVLAEFADASEDVQNTLVRAARGGTLDHFAQQARQDRRAEKAVVKRAAEYESAGYTVLGSEYDRWHVPGQLDGLRTPEGERITPEAHEACPGQAVWIGPAPWLDGDVMIAHACTDPAGNGHHVLVATAFDGDVRSRPADPEAAREARRELVAKNREMLAAQTVRHSYVRTLIGVKKHHRVMAAWALQRITQRDSTFARWLRSSDDRVLREVLGAEPCKVLNDAPAHQHPVLVWAQICASYEAELPKDAWRNPPALRTGIDDYLAHLVALGYTPCDTEQQMLDTRQPRRRLGEGWAYTGSDTTDDRADADDVAGGDTAVDATDPDVNDSADADAAESDSSS